MRAVVYRFSTEVNATRVRNVMSFLDKAIHFGELELLLAVSSMAEARLRWAKQAYLYALRSAGRTSFSTEDVGAFEARSVRLETIIRQLQVRSDSWKKLSEELSPGSGDRENNEVDRSNEEVG